MSRTRLVMFASMVVFLWGSAFVLVRVALEHFTPIDLSLLRFSLGGAIFAALLKLGFIRYRPVDRKDWPRLIAGAALAIPTYHLALNLAQSRVPAVTAGLFGQLTPALTFVFAVWLGHEEFSRRRMFGLGLAILGAVAMLRSAIATPELGGAGIYLVLALVPPIALAAFTVVSKSLVGRYGAANTAAQTVIIGALMISPFGMASHGLVTRVTGAPLTAWLAVVSLAAGVTVGAYSLWSFLLERLPRSRVASLINLTPIVTIGLSAAFLDEPLRPATLFAGAIMIAGTAIVLRSAPNRHRNLSKSLDLRANSRRPRFTRCPS